MKNITLKYYIDILIINLNKFIIYALVNFWMHKVFIESAKYSFIAFESIMFYRPSPEEFEGSDCMPQIFCILLIYVY